MKNRGLGLLAIFLFGCSPVLPELKKAYTAGVNAVVLNKTTVLSSSDSLIFETQFSFLDLYGHFDLGYLLQQDFSFTSDGTYHILDFRKSMPTIGIPATVMILEDESGDYSIQDPNNFRSKMINKLCQDVQLPGGFIVGGFSRQGKIAEPAEFSSADFSTDWRNQQDFVFSLSGRTGGNSSLYDALFLALNKLAAETSQNKNLVVLVHAGDSASSASLSDVINKAVAGQIKIHVLFLGESDNAGVIPQLSSLTGGIFAILPTDQELITVFNHLYRLLSGEKYVYTLKTSYKPPSGGLSEADVTHALTIRDEINDKDFNPVLIFTRIP